MGHNLSGNDVASNFRSAANRDNTYYGDVQPALGCGRLLTDLERETSETYFYPMLVFAKLGYSDRYALPVCLSFVVSCVVHCGRTVHDRSIVPVVRYFTN